VETELVLDGLKQGSVPPSAHVCPVGAGEWVPIADASPFSESLRGNGGSSSEEACMWAATDEALPAIGEPALDLTEPLLGYLAHWQDATLPDESVLLGTLEQAPPEILIQQQAMWNLALCVALGSERLASAATHFLF